MDYLRDLLAVDSKQALEFFFEKLKEAVVSGNISESETLYVASILAHYARTSQCDAVDMPPPGNLSDIFSTFALPMFVSQEVQCRNDPKILELTGSQTLFLVGFFRDQMEGKHNLDWYDRLGQSCFYRAGQYFREQKRAMLLKQVAGHFSIWAISCRNMSRNFRKNSSLFRLGS